MNDEMSIDAAKDIAQRFWKSVDEVVNIFPYHPNLNEIMTPIIGTAVSLIIITYLQGFPESLRNEVKQMLIKTISIDGA